VANQEKHILMVDDSPDDTRLLALALAECMPSLKLRTVPNAVRAVSYLSRQAPYALEPEIDLIIMDLNMPVNSGHEAIRTIRDEPTWDHIPIYVFSSSTRQMDIDKSYAVGAAGHIRKPSRFGQYLDLAQSFSDYIELRNPIKESLARSRTG
jgi:CheY-like chemotaxis protein